VTELELLATDFASMSRELRGMDAKVLPLVAREMEFETKRNLLEGVDANGTAFAPLADGSGRRPLLKSLGLFNAVRGSVRGNAAVVECDVPYAGIQNQGGTVLYGEKRRGPGEKPWVFVSRDGATVFTRRIAPHKVVIPARQFMGAGVRMLDACVKVVVDFADKVFAGGR
jgi:phage gpG-like protein